MSSVSSVVNNSKDDLAMSDLIHKELSESIIGAAMTVLNALKPGLDEKLYERALTIELTRLGHRVAAQRQYPVFTTTTTSEL